jgi:hypothetical protein
LQKDHRPKQSFFLSGNKPASRRKRRTMRALYAFCRTGDNLADGNVEQPDIKLRQLREGIRGGQKNAHDEALTAWADLSNRYQIPICYAEQLLDGVERDLVQQRYDTFEELSVYCYSVASTVGLMCMYYTPQDWLRNYNLEKGAAFGLSHNFLQVGYLRPQNRHAHYKNLYFTGASTHPGTGLPIVLLSAQLTAERILKERGQPIEKRAEHPIPFPTRAKPALSTRTNPHATYQPNFSL